MRCLLVPCDQPVWRMRDLIGALVALAFCLGILSEAIADDVHPLSPSEIGQAADGRVICMYPVAAGCRGGILIIDEVTDHAMRTREITAFRISSLVSGPQRLEAERMTTFSNYSGLFEAIGRLERSGGFSILKLVAPSEMNFDAPRSLWCESAGTPISGLEFYLSNSTSPDLSRDFRLPPDLTLRVREFLTNLMRDEAIRADQRENVDLLGWMDTQLGIQQLCVTRYGLHENGKVNITSMQYSVRDGPVLKGFGGNADMRDAAEAMLVPG